MRGCCSLQISSWPWVFWGKACRRPGTPGSPGDSSSGSLLSGELAARGHRMGHTLCVPNTNRPQSQHARLSQGPWAPGGQGRGWGGGLSRAHPHRAAIFSQFSAACSFFILLSWLPTFFKETFPSSKVGGAESACQGPLAVPPTWRPERPGPGPGEAPPRPGPPMPRARASRVWEGREGTALRPRDGTFHQHRAPGLRLAGHLWTVSPEEGLAGA